MQSKMTRRSVLAGAPAFAAVVAMPVQVAAGDELLLTRIAAFHEIYDPSNNAHERWISEKERVEALPNCPPYCTPAEDRGAYNKYSKFFADRGVHALCERSNDLNMQCGKAALAVFATPAQTMLGAIEKLKIAYLAIGDGDGTCTGDRDLEAFQDLDAPWMESVMADLERLAGGAA